MLMKTVVNNDNNTFDLKCLSHNPTALNRHKNYINEKNNKNMGRRQE